jgi:hypothetical protein
MLAAGFIEKRLGARLLLLLCGIVALSAAGIPPAVAQGAPSPAPNVTQPQPKHPKKAKETTPPPPDPTVPVPATAPNLFDQPALPATVSAADNKLTVRANNSSLAQILHQVASKTGMQLDGLGGDERVFGSFGPGAPREVLTALLNGTSYNVVMVGDLPNGAPRELLLTHREGGSGTGSPVNAAQNQNPNNPNGQNGEDATQDDSANSDDSDDSAPPMQYTPPSITPAEPPPQQQQPGPNIRPGPAIQNRPQ